MAFFSDKIMKIYGYCIVNLFLFLRSSSNQKLPNDVYYTKRNNILKIFSVSHLHLGAKVTKNASF